MLLSKGFKSLIIILISFLILGVKSYAQDSIKISHDEYIKYNRTKQKLFYSTSDSVTFNLSFMAYACGDCYPQYRIDSVFFTDNQSKSFYLNKEIHVEFINKKLIKQINSMDCSGTCYRYSLSGILKRNGFGLFKLYAVKGTITKQKKCCEDN